MRLGLNVILGAALACGADSKDIPRTDSANAAAPGEGSRGTTAKTSSIPNATVGSRADVLIVGTSLTAGYGLEDPGDSYPSVLQRMADSAGFKIAVQNAGLSGETSAGALRRIDWLLRTDYALVIIETGANDGLRGLDIDSTRANLRAVVRRVRAALPRAKIALFSMEAPPNLGATYTRRFRESFEVVAREEGVTLMPFLLDGVAGVANLNQRDGIHPNVEGALRVASNVWGGLQPLLAPYR